MAFEKKKTIALVCLSLLGLVLVSGCFTMNVHATANTDGTVSDYRVELTTSSFVYNLLKESAKENGYANVREYVEAESGPGSISYEEVWDDDSVTLKIRSNEPVTPDGSNWTITKEDGYLIYNDLRFQDGEEEMDTSDKLTGALLSDCVLHYYLEMPGKIVDSNANTVNEKSAEWHLTGSDIFKTTIYAKSEVPATSLPGFGALLAIVACAFIALRRTS
ncbi:hypothetical protein RJ40_12565 [Methanofollis aquaemaris]|uniref:PGF-CTERM sorting domain-containing protein n=1 Tax=Methanofollis aquaemaris TaxID=126734 RepID=A0A8A3S7L2_9EURY|nr:hypothetical protein [Methanofollis aquaemaris]QSZ68267.1 hypothetical protein RJ40_12565 [Methanofollis aquaemaris]